VIVNDSYLNLSSNADLSNAIIISATNSNGGILQTSGSGGIKNIANNGDIDLLSKGQDINIGLSPIGTSVEEQTQNINIDCFNDLSVVSGDMYFVSSDIISFVSQTGDIQFGTGTNSNPILKFENGNILINQTTSNLDYQLDIGITDSSTSNHGYNGLMINTKMSNVAADLTLQTSNTLGDGTQCILSIGTFGSDNNYAIFNTYTAYQINNAIIRSDSDTYNPNSLSFNNGKDFIYTDIGRQIYWPSLNRNDTIIGLSSMITPINDSSNVTVSGTYSGETSRIYLLVIDSIGSDSSNPSTFKWSNNGGYTYQKQLIPIPISPTPISLDSNISITFINTIGFTYNQQFLFQTKITALVDTDFTISNPIPLYLLQPFYAYINTSTPSDIVIKTNNHEKMRITGDGAIGIQQNIPKAALDLNSNYNKVINVNQSITGYQVNPAITNLSSGGYVIIWNSQDSINPEQHFDIIAQRYLTDGSKYGDNFQVNVQQRKYQSLPTVACCQLTNSNHYIVCWVNYNINTNKYYIYCQIFHNNLPISPNDIEITSVELPNILSNPRVAGLYNGNYIVVWDQDDGSGILNIVGTIIIDTPNSALTINTPFPINPTTPSVSRTFPFVIGLPLNDTYTPNGFVVAYMTAINTNPDPQYTISLRVFNSIGDPTTNEIAITSISSNQYSNISDGLVSLAEINNNNVNGTNGGFIITFYRSYLADTSLYQSGDPIEGLISGATARISTTIPPNPSLRQITIDNLSNRFLVSEEIRINSTIPNSGSIIEKISAITFDPVLNQATITLDIGSKDIEAYRFNSNLTSFNDSLWSSSPVVNTSPLYNDLDRFTSNSFIFQYKRPMSYVTVDNEGTALITWSNDSIPSIYYQLIDVETGYRIGIEQKLTTDYNGLKQRNQVAAQLHSIQGNDCGFVIAWDNQSISLNLQDTGIFQQLIGYKHSLLNLEDGNSNFTFNHNNQLGIGTTNPDSSLHVKTKLNDNSNDDPPNPAIIILQNTSQHVITNQDLQTIQFRDGSHHILNKIQSINSLRYDDLYPQPNNLIGFYKFDETQGSQVKDYSIYNTNRSNTTSYINTNGILNNFNLETCWVPGIINNSLLFNGQNNYIFIEKTASNNLNTILEQSAHQLSISLWFNIPSDMIINSSYDIVSNGGSEIIPGTFLLMISDNNNDGTLRLLSGVSVHDPTDVNDKYAITTFTSINNDSQWHHIVLTINVNNDIGNINTYIDGILEQTNSSPGSITAIQHDYTKTYIGSRDGINNFFRGNMDELRFYNSILTPTEITQLYNYGNPNQPAKASLILSPNSTPTHNQSIVIDDHGIINNLSSRPLPYTLLSGSLTAYNNNSNILGSDTNFTNELTVGDIIVLGNDETNNDFTVISILDNTHLTLDRRGYSGVESNTTFQSVLRKPSIYTFYDNSDSIRGNIDNYGNLMIGNSKPSTMLEISGVSGNDNSIPAITITNTTLENSDQSRQTALNFRSYDATNTLNPFVNLGSIETSHYGSGVDNKASMKFIINNGDTTGTNSTNLVTLTSNGIGFGGETVPLTLLHAVTQTSTEECSLLLQSSYVEVSSNTPSIFDERSNIYFGGGVTINDNSGDIKSRVLCSISGSKDTTDNVSKGRLDFNTNDNNPVGASNQYFLESRMSIVNTGNVGIDIKTPANIFNVGPELRYQGIKTYIDTTNTNGTIITLQNNVFTGMTLEQKKMFFGSSLIVENNDYTRCTIESVDLTGGINNIVTVNSNLSTYVGKTVTIHYAGLNVVKHTGTYSGTNYTPNSGFIGINTTNPGSVLGVNGSLSLPIITTLNNITLDCTHYTILCNTSINTITVTLPTNINSMYGRIYRIKNINGANYIYINPDNAKIDDISYTTPPYYTVTTSFIHLQSDGTDWWVIG
jgi:hypothetical protein